MAKNQLFYLILLIILTLIVGAILLFPSKISLLSKTYLFNNFSDTGTKNLNFIKPTEDTVKNFLFLGIAGAGSRGSLLTDSIIIISLNKTEEKIHLISFPRDLLVKAPNSNNLLKLNSLFELENKNKKYNESKSFDLIKTKMEEISGLKIDEVIVLDLEAVKSLVDTLGGIDIYLEKDFFDPNLVNPHNPSQMFYLEAGWQHLDGDLFLKMIRSRYAPDGDFSRMKNQQLLLSALKEKLAQSLDSSSIISWVQIWQSLADHYFTSFSLTDLTNLLLLAKEVKDYPIEGTIISAYEPNKLLVSSGYYDGLGKYVYALVPKAGLENYEEIQNFIYSLIDEQKSQ